MGIQVNVTQIFERAVLEPLEPPRLTGSTPDIVKRKDAAQYLDDEFRWDIGTDDLEGSICSEVPFTRRTSRVEGCRVRECFLLFPGQTSGRRIRCHTHVHTSTSNIQKEAFTLLNCKRTNGMVFLSNTRHSRKRGVNPCA